METEQAASSLRKCAKCGSTRFLRSEKSIVEVIDYDEGGVEDNLIEDIGYRYECVECSEGWDE